MGKNQQIFYTQSPTRWNRTKWLFRSLLFILFLAILLLAISIYFTDRNLPDLPIEGRAIRKVLTDTLHSYHESNLEKEYKGFRKEILMKGRNGINGGKEKNQINNSTPSQFNDSLGIRAAFYVNWDMPQSFQSLEKNISKVNLILPEWLFINPFTDELYSSIDERALGVMKRAHVKVTPMLSNNYNSVFRGDAVKRIIENPVKRKKFLHDIIVTLKKYRFDGINIDFEDLKFESDQSIIDFQKELYDILHQMGMLVTQDVIPFNTDYNYKELNTCNDYLILMAYDQHTAETKAGPNCSQKWVEGALDNIAKQVPYNKIILAMAAFGHNWMFSDSQVKRVTDVTYQQAMALASNSAAKVTFDNDTYNLNFEYYDTENNLHQVYFVDAATNFNILRFTTEMKLGGVALWRLGGEDSRLWSFYDHPMTSNALKHFDFRKFDFVEASVSSDFEGEGEILDIQTAPNDGLVRHQLDLQDYLISEEEYEKLPSSYVIRRFGSTDKKKIVLSFDDGPDPKFTKEILDTLAFYHVPAAFFVTGYQVENNIPLLKRMYREGHEIGNHTFTHPDMSKVSLRRAALEMDATRLIIECITGRSTILFRAPFNADSEPGKSEELKPLLLSREKNYITVGASIDPNDWEPDIQNESAPADTVFKRIINIYNKKTSTGNPEDSTINGSIILLHDAGGDRRNTVKATGMIIRYFRSKGYSFTSIADLLGKSKTEIMPPVDRGKEYYMLSFNYLLAGFGYMMGNLLFVLFLAFLLFGSIRLVFLGIFAILENNKRKKWLSTLNFHSTEKVSIIVPAYNEEINIISSLNNLLKCDHTNFDIIFVDDGSKDNTYNLVKTHFLNHAKISVFTKENGGKASALNFGIEKSDAKFVVCIDADTRLSQNAVSLLLRNFYLANGQENEKVAAVAGTVKVGNEVNLLTKWQSIEYITSQNFDRKGFSFLNAITVIPGAIGAFRKSILAEIGGFSSDTLAEDCDLTIRIIKSGYLVKNEPSAYAFTEVPETIQQFIKQRFRWSFGVMQTFWKHKQLLFNTQIKSLGLVAFPDMLLFRYLIPLFMPVADIIMLIALIRNDYDNILIYFIIYLIVDSLVASLSFAFEKENPLKIIWLIPQRLIYRWIMMFIFFMAFRRALKGELQSWGALKRTGNVATI